MNNENKRERGSEVQKTIWWWSEGRDGETGKIGEGEEEV